MTSASKYRLSSTLCRYTSCAHSLDEEWDQVRCLISLPVFSCDLGTEIACQRASTKQLDIAMARPHLDGACCCSNPEEAAAQLPPPPQRLQPHNGGQHALPPCSASAASDPELRHQAPLLVHF